MINFKKIATVVGSALMIGSTVAMAAAANYPSPFTNDAALVVGSGAAGSDWVAAASIRDKLPVSGSTTTTTASASGGDSINLASSSQKLFYNSALNAAKTTLTKSEMPTILADGTVSDDSGTTYAYTQTITLGSRTISYGTSGSDWQDPELYVDVGISTASPLYTYKLNLNKVLNVTNTDVRGNEIEILGTKYTIGSSSDGSTSVIELFGTGTSVTLNSGEETTVTIDGIEHIVKVNLITQTGGVDQVSVSIDGGDARTISEGSSSKVSAIEVYAKDIAYTSRESDTPYATLNLGTGKLKLQNNQAVLEGTDELAIQNTLVTISTSSGDISSVQIDIAAQDSVEDWLKEGTSFVDPVFGGLKVNLASIVPTLEDSSRQKFKVDSSGSRDLRVTFTTELVGEEKLFNFLHDADTSTSTTTPNNTDSSGSYKIHVNEDDSIKNSEYAIINSGDYGRIIKVTGLPGGAILTSSRIRIADALTGQELITGGIPITATPDTPNAGNGSATIDGQNYYFRVTNASASTDSTVKITWGTGAYHNNVGTYHTLFPRIKLKGGGWMSIMYPTMVTNGTSYALPGVETLASYEAPTNITFAKNSTSYGSVDNITVFAGQKYGNINWTVEYTAGNVTFNTTGHLMGINLDTSGGITDAPDCNFNYTYGGAILFIEEKKTTETGNSDNGDIVCIAATKVGSTTVELGVNTPQVTGTWSSLQTWNSDTYKSSGVTRYGTKVLYDSNDNHYVEIAYPNDQMYADILVSAEAATISGGSVTTAGSTGYATVYDSEVDSVKSKNLIVVGGSCINTVAAKLLGKDAPACEAEFTTLAGIEAGQALIKTFTSPYSSAKVAMLVAGYNAADTTKAASYLSANTVDTTVGTALKVTSATEATAITA